MDGGMIMEYTITLNDFQINAVLTALGAKAWETRETTAYATYDGAYKAIQQQVKNNTRI